MMSVSEAVFDIVLERKMVMEGMSRNLFNLSALARDLLPEVAKRVKKPVKNGAIVMALTRISVKIKHTSPKKKTEHSFSDMTVRSGLVEMTYANSPELPEKHQRLYAHLQGIQHSVCTISQGAFETTIIISKASEDAVREIFSRERLISSYTHLSSISIKLESGVVEILGTYAWLLNVIAWEGINIVEVVSTYTELTVVVREKDIDRAFCALRVALKKH